MAFKPIDPDATISVVSVLDEAIEHDDSFAKFFDPANGDCFSNPEKWGEFLTAKDGMSITEYIIGTIPSGEMNRIEDKWRNEKGWSQLRWACFAASLRDILNGPTMETTDQNGRPKSSVPKSEGRVDPQWLANIYQGLHRHKALEIGLHAWRLQQFEKEAARP